MNKKADPSLLLNLVFEWRDIARLLKDIPEQRALKAAYMNCAGMLESRLGSLEQAIQEAPEGWKLVPKTPTKEMLVEGISTIDNTNSFCDKGFTKVAREWDMDMLYKAMLLKVPPSPKE